MPKKTYQYPRKQGQRKKTSSKRIAYNIHNQFYIQKIEKWIAETDLTLHQAQTLSNLLNKFFLCQGGSIYFNRKFQNKPSSRVWLGKEVDHEFVEKLGVSFLSKWSKYDKKRNRIKYI